MKKIVGYSIIILMLALVTAYLAGVLAQLYHLSQAWAVGEEIIFKDNVHTDILIVKDYFLTQTGLIAWMVLISLSLIIAYFFKLQFGTGKTDDRGVKYTEEGTYGTAKWMDDATAKEVFSITSLKRCKSVIFGEHGEMVVSQSLSNFGNKHIMIFGASGSGKSFSFVRPNIFQVARMGQSMVITDPKGELYQDMALVLKSMGYNVKVFNLVQPIHSDRWNPLSEVYGEEADLKAQVFSEVVITNTKMDVKKSGDPFWDRAEQNLLKALSLYIAKDYPVQNRNLGELYTILSCGDSQKVDMIFEKLPDTHPAKAPYNIYKQANDKVRTGVVIGLGTRLQVFQNQTIKNMTAANDIDLVAPGREKCAYFCIMSDTTSTLDYLASLYFSFLFIRLMEYADTRGGKGEKEIYFMLDEFANIGQIPDFVKKIATMRSRGLHCHIIIQSIAQLKEKYMLEGTEVIMANCDTKLCLGVNDTLTAEFVSKSIGTATIETVGHKKELGFEGLFDFGSESRDHDKRLLLNPEEVKMLPKDNAIVMLRGNNPMIVKKMGWNKHFMYKKVKTQKITDYIPQWSIELDKPYSVTQNIEVVRSEKPPKPKKPLSVPIAPPPSQEKKANTITKETSTKSNSEYIPKPFKNYRVKESEAVKKSDEKDKSSNPHTQVRNVKSDPFFKN